MKILLIVLAILIPSVGMSQVQKWRCLKMKVHRFSDPKDSAYTSNNCYYLVVADFGIDRISIYIGDNKAVYDIVSKSDAEVDKKKFPKIVRQLSMKGVDEMGIDSKLTLAIFNDPEWDGLLTAATDNGMAVYYLKKIE